MISNLFKRYMFCIILYMGLQLLAMFYMGILLVVQSDFCVFEGLSIDMVGFIKSLDLHDSCIL